MNKETAPTSGIAVLLSVLGWVAAILSAVYICYLAMVANSGGGTPFWTLPVLGVISGMLFVGVAKIIEQLAGIEHLLLKQSRT